MPEKNAVCPSCEERVYLTERQGRCFCPACAVELDVAAARALFEELYPTKGETEPEAEEPIGLNLPAESNGNGYKTIELGKGDYVVEGGTPVSDGGVSAGSAAGASDTPRAVPTNTPTNVPKKPTTPAKTPVGKKKPKRSKPQRSAQAIKDGRRAFLLCLLTASIGLGLMYLLVFVGYARGLSEWAENTAIAAMGFDSFFDFEGVGKGAATVAGAAAILVAVVFVFVILGDGGDLTTIVAGVLLGGGITYLAVRLVIVGVGYVIYWLIHPIIIPILGLTVLILFRIFTRKQKGFGIMLKRLFASIFIIILTMNFFLLGTAMYNGASGDVLEGALLEILSDLLAFLP